ncbi:MAG TPA: thioesterase family protein, partial [Steroidobacteraceae bacterium]
IDDAYRRSGRAMYTAESHLIHKAEAHSQEQLYVLSRVLEVDEKRVRLLHALHRTRDDALVASGELLYLHVSTQGGRVSPMDAELQARLAAIQAATR